VRRAFASEWGLNFRRIKRKEKRQQEDRKVLEFNGKAIQKRESKSEIRFQANQIQDKNRCWLLVGYLLRTYTEKKKKGRIKKTPTRRGQIDLAARVRRR